VVENSPESVGAAVAAKRAKVTIVDQDGAAAAAAAAPTPGVRCVIMSSTARPTAEARLKAAASYTSAEST